MPRHELTIDYAGKEQRFTLRMPIGRAHQYAAALCAEFMAAGYTLNEVEHTLGAEEAMD